MRGGTGSGFGGQGAWRGLCGVAIVAALVLAAGRADAKLIKVRAPGGPASITEAVSEANAGDTLALAPGTYSLKDTGEQWPIFVEIPITIRGVADSTKCVIVPDGTQSGQRYMEIGCFIFRNMPTGQVVLKHLSFQKGGTTPGVAMDIYKCHAIVEGCCFTDLSTGVRIGGETVARVTGCVLKGTAVGITATKAEVEFNNNYVTGGKKGILLEWSKGAVRGNKLYKADADGICLNHSDDVKVEDNYVEGAAQCGIAMLWSSPEVTGNELVANKYSIWCSQKSAPAVKRNIVRRSQSYDLGCEKDGSPVVGGSLADANFFYGDGTFLVNNMTEYPIEARYNFWGTDCPDAHRFNGQVRFAPWTERTHQKQLDRCN